jgi:opacity protein-like surface antigen
MNLKGGRLFLSKGIQNLVHYGPALKFRDIRITNLNQQLTMKTACIIAVLTLFTFDYSQGEVPAVDMAARSIPAGLFRQPEPANTPVDFLRGRIDFSIFVLPNLAIGGAGSYLGSEMQLFNETTWQVDLPDDVLFDTRTDYGDRTVPIVTNPETAIPFYLNLGYNYENTRIGLSWSRMSASWAQSGDLPGLDFYSDNQVQGSGFGFVSFWNMGWDLHLDRGFPAAWIESFRDHGEIEDSLDTSIPYDSKFFPDKGNTLWEASNDISFNSFQLTARYPIINNENLQLSLTGGLQYGRWKDNLRQMLNITAYRDTTDRWVQIVPANNQDSILVEVFFTSTFHNDITLETNSSAKFNAFGLLGGFDATWRITPSLSLLIGAGVSTLSGNASYSGTGIDIDDIFFSDRFVLYDMDENRFPFDPETGTEFLSGEFNLPEYTIPMLSVGYNMNFSARYDINDYFSVMAGYHYSIWTNLPLSPQWSYSDWETRPYGAFAVEESWNKQRSSNLSASGFLLGIGLRF